MSRVNTKKFPPIKESHIEALSSFFARFMFDPKELTRWLEKSGFPRDEVANDPTGIRFFEVKTEDRIRVNFHNIQLKKRSCNNILNFITKVLDPDLYVNNLTRYNTHRKSLNNIIGLFSFELQQNGRLKRLKRNLSIEEIADAQKNDNDQLKTKVKDSDVKLQTLEDLLVDMIYDYTLKTPADRKKASPSITIQRKRAVKERDNFQCQLCQEQFEEENLEIDHIFPYGLGGSNEKMNLMSLCEPCNGDKGKRLNYYRSEEGRKKLEDNIRSTVKNLTIITNFSQWLRNIGDSRRKS